MPIRPENRARYPKNWKAISLSIRERAGNRCEGSPDFPDCRRPNGAYLNKTSGEITTDEMQVEAWTCADGDRVSRIVLTVAHLDHTPENCDPSNLKAMCQRCHLNYDKAHHANTAYSTRKARAGTADLFTAPAAPSAPA